MDDAPTNPEPISMKTPDEAAAATPVVPLSHQGTSTRRTRRAQGTAKRTTSQLTLGEYAAQQLAFERACSANGEGKLSTVENWESLIKALPPWLAAMPLASLKRRDCERYFAELQAAQTAGNLAETTVEMRKRFLRALVQRARQADLIDSNPCAVVLRAERNAQGRGAGAREITEAQTLSAEQLVHVLVVAACVVPPLFFVLVAVMLMTGLLGSEARALQLGDLEFDHVCGGVRRPRLCVRRIEHHGTLSVAGWEERYVDVPPVLEAILRWWIATRGLTEKDAWLFPGPLPRKGSRRAQHVPPDCTNWCVPRETLDGAWRRIRSRALPTSRLTLTALHHAFCTVSLQLGEDPLYVSLQVGHRSLKYTRRAYGSFLDIPSQGTSAAPSAQLQAALESACAKAAEAAARKRRS